MRLNPSYGTQDKLIAYSRRLASRPDLSQPNLSPELWAVEDSF